MNNFGPPIRARSDPYPRLIRRPDRGTPIGPNHTVPYGTVPVFARIPGNKLPGYDHLVPLGQSPTAPYGTNTHVSIRRSELEPDRSLVGSVRDYRFELRQIRIWVYRYNPKMIDVRLGGDPLHIVRLDIFDKDYILSPILEPANDDKFAEYAGPHFHRGLSVWPRKRSSLRNYRISRRVLNNHSLLPYGACVNVTVIDIPH